MGGREGLLESEFSQRSTSVRREVSYNVALEFIHTSYELSGSLRVLGDFGLCHVARQKRLLDSHVI